MIKKIIIIALLIWGYNNSDTVCDSLVRFGIGFKAGVDASHKSYQVQYPDGGIAAESKKSNPNLPGPDGLIDPYPEE